MPKVLPTAEGRCAVLRPNAEHVLHSLRVDAEDNRRQAAGAGDEIADAELADRTESGRRKHRRIDRLRAATHECERRDFDRAALHERVELLRIHRVVERVEERPHVRVDLREDVARQEAEPLARLDRGAREDDPPDLPLDQRRDGEGDGEVRLAGSGRADPERDGAVADRVDVASSASRSSA